jgi:NDP-hexose-3-ketoreductase
MKETKVAVWGLGPHARKNILPALKSLPGLRLYGVYSRNAEVVASACAEFGCATWATVDEMLEDREVDVVYLSTPIGLHVSQGMSVLLSGKHLWCEKPLATNGKEVAALTRLSRTGAVTVAEGFMYLYHPQFAYLETVLQSGRLGYIQTVTCRFGIPPLDRPGFRNSRELGGGAFLDVGSYPVSAVVSLFPGSQPEVAFSEILVEPGSSVDSAGSAVLCWGGGMRAVLEWRVGSSYRNELDVWGTNGSVSSERIFSKPPDYVPRFRFLDRQGVESFESGQAANHFERMFLAFRALIGDAAAAEIERLRIERCAVLMDKVRGHSRRQG